MNICAHPECNEEGNFPAPKDTSNLREWQYFCQQHIKEFNRQWDGLEGMSQADIYAMEIGATWDRPTWKLGTSNHHKTTFDENFANADELFNFFKQRQTEDNPHRTVPADVKEACVILSLELPSNQDELKRKYIALMKKHHPDKNQGDEQAQDFAKKINVAYQILSEWII